MHETSIVNSIMRTLEQEFEAEKLNRMKAIYVKVGILSNIEPRLLHNAYSAYHLTHPQYHHVELDVQKYRFICDKCDRPSKNVIQGEEMLIHKVEFED